MAIVRKLPPEYFLKFKEKPVKLKPFSKKQLDIANLYLKRVRKLLSKFDLKIMVRGSTAFKISGKGDVEIGVYPKDSDWNLVIEVLQKEFGNPENVEEDYVRFNDIHNNIEVEIILQKGEEAIQDIKLHKYLIDHSKLLKKYEMIKKKYSFSKREYQIQKNKFLTGVAEKIAG